MIIIVAAYPIVDRIDLHLGAKTVPNLQVIACTQATRQHNYGIYVLT